MTRFVHKDEQIQLIMECRQSGLNDFQWCEQNGINPGTFYNWVSKLRKSGYSFPDSKSKTDSLPNKQEVVRLNLMEDQEPLPPAIVEQTTGILQKPSTQPRLIAEVSVGHSQLKLYDGIRTSQIQALIAVLGGGAGAW